jgi:hypothetical protein
MSELVHVPAQMSHSELSLLLEHMLEGLRTGDTVEGTITFTVSDTPDRWDVIARYRIDNLIGGQGGVRMIGELVEREDGT